MAKKKAHEPAVSVDTAMSIKMTVAFRDWIAEVAEFDRSTSVQIVEKGVVEYARKIGFPKQAPRRTDRR